MRLLIFFMLLPHLLLGQALSVPKYSIVEIPTHSRSIAMGGTGVASAVGNQQLNGNIGKSVFTPHLHQVSVSHLPWLRALFADTKFMRVDYLTTVGESSTLGFDINYLDLGNLTLRDNNGASLSIHPNYQFNVGSSVGVRLSDHAGIGVGLNWLSAKQFDSGFPTTAHTVSGDLHYYQFVQLGSPRKQLQWGIAFNNVTAATHQVSTTAVGIAYQSQQENNDQWMVGLDIRKSLYPWSQPIQFAVGSEYIFDEQFFLRGGFGWESVRSGHRRMITIGAGYKGFVADQSFSLDVHTIVPVRSATLSPFQHSYGLSLGINIGNFQ